MAKDEELLAQRANDKLILIGIVRDIGGQLKMIVFQRRDLFRGEYRNLFPGPWHEIEGHLNDASHEIEAMQSDDPKWKYVEGAGLVREQLKFKRNMLTTAIEQGPVARLLKVMNSILGSLSGAFPVLEAVKEYKEHVEAAIAIQNRWK